MLRYLLHGCSYLMIVLSIAPAARSQEIPEVVVVPPGQHITHFNTRTENLFALALTDRKGQILTFHNDYDFLSLRSTDRFQVIKSWPLTDYGRLRSVPGKSSVILYGAGVAQLHYEKSTIQFFTSDEEKWSGSHFDEAAYYRQKDEIFAGNRAGDIVAWKINSDAETLHVHWHSSDVVELDIHQNLGLSCDDQGTVLLWNVDKIEAPPQILHETDTRQYPDENPQVTGTNRQHIFRFLGNDDLIVGLVHGISWSKPQLELWKFSDQENEVVKIKKIRTIDLPLTWHSPILTISPDLSSVGVTDGQQLIVYKISDNNLVHFKGVRRELKGPEIFQNSRTHTDMQFLTGENKILISWNDGWITSVDLSPINQK